MPPEDTFHQLQTVLQQFKTFLDTNKNTIKPAVEALKTVVPQVVDLIDKLIALMTEIKTEIKTEINNINPAAIPGLQQVTEFTGQVSSFLTTARPLLPAAGASTVDEVQSALGVVSGLGNLQGIKTQLLALIDDINADLNFLKS